MFMLITSIWNYYQFWYGYEYRSFKIATKMNREKYIFLWSQSISVASLSKCNRDMTNRGLRITISFLGIKNFECHIQKRYVKFVYSEVIHSMGLKLPTHELEKLEISYRWHCPTFLAFHTRSIPLPYTLVKSRRDRHKLNEHTNNM